jgi:hypothetical protein
MSNRKKWKQPSLTHDYISKFLKKWASTEIFKCRARVVDKQEGEISSVVHRSIYRENAAFMNCVLEIATKCQDTQITHFINNLDDLA